jgi:aspartate-semialdehyde dehydrogenase
VHANCARVPTFIGHAEYVNIETEKPISDTAVREILRHAPGISIVDHRANEGYATPAEVAGEDAVFVSRIRVDTSVENGVSFWCVADNLRKGAALNAVQIAEVLVKDYLGVKR